MAFLGRFHYQTAARHQHFLIGQRHRFPVLDHIPGGAKSRHSYQGRNPNIKVRQPADRLHPILAPVDIQSWELLPQRFGVLFFQDIHMPGGKFPYLLGKPLQIMSCRKDGNRKAIPLPPHHIQGAAPYGTGTAKNGKLFH